LILGVGLCAAPARAEQVIAGAGDASARADALMLARQHFARGIEFYRASAYDAALAEFSRAYELLPSHRILFNLAQIQAQRQEYVEALDLFTRYLTEGAGKLPDERVAAVQKEIGELRRRVAELRVESNVEGATLLVNEVPAAQLPLTAPVRVNAGILRLRIEKVGYRSVSRRVTVVGGESSLVHAELEPTAPPLDLDALPPQLKNVTGAPARTAPLEASLWLGLTTTGAFAAATAICGVLTYQESRTVDRRLSSYPEGLDRIDAARSKLRLVATLTDAFALSTVLSAGVTTALHFSSVSARPLSDGPEFGGQLGPDGGRLWLRGRL
jgi:tetratricopeptide (TPR) repeat protein